MTTKQFLSGACMAALIMGTLVIQGQNVDAAIKKVYVTKGESAIIKVKKAKKKTKWKVSNSKIAKVKSGKKSVVVKGKKKGNTTVSAKIAKKKVKYKIIVETPKISHKSITLKVGETTRVVLSGTKRFVKWQEEDMDIAEVNAITGEISAIKEGTTAVYAKVGKKKYSCQVTVKANTPDAKEAAANHSSDTKKAEDSASEPKKTGSGVLDPVPDGYLTEIKEKGTVTTVEYEGTQANGAKVKKRAYVYLPYGYDAKKQYDIVYFLHGGEGDTLAYLGTDSRPGQVKIMLDHMILKGDIKPMIAVAPTYYTSKSDGADMGNAISKIQNFTKKELVNDLIPAVEGKYSTYAKTTDLSGLKESRDHRGYAGFSMGSLSAWYTFLNSSDYFHFIMPMSGDCWVNGSSNANKAAEQLEAYCKEKEYRQDDFFIYAVTGSKDIAYSAMKAQIDAMKTKSPSFVFTEQGAGTGNISFKVEPNAEHSFVYLPIYLYNGLRAYFK